MRCPKCGSDNREGRKFCAKCGGALVRSCPKCGARNDTDEDFCGDCGAPLQASPSSPPTAQPTIGERTFREPWRKVQVTSEDSQVPLDGERKTVTALFADIKGSTELEQDLDPEEARAIVDPALEIMIDAVRQYDGYIVQSTGDGVFAIFGAPLAQEDHAQRAIHAAVRMHHDNVCYAEKLRAAGHAPLQIRVGVNTGEVVIRSLQTGAAKTEYTPIGHTTNLASRVQALANPNSTAITDTTRRLVEGYFAMKSLGASPIKGITQAVPLFEVVGLGPLRTRLQRSARRGYTKFVGRDAEMALLQRAMDLAKTANGQIVAAVADAGVGKSRLFHEFKAKNPTEWLVLEANSIPYGKATAYAPVIELLRSYFAIEASDDVRRRREKVIGKVLGLDPGLEDTLPYVLGLLGLTEGRDPLAAMDVQIRKRRTLDALKRILLRESLNQPLMIILEDLHWVDEETQAFLDLLVDSLVSAKLLLLVDYRLEYSHCWNSNAHYTEIRLDPLGHESADEMMTAMVGDGEHLVPIKRFIIEKAERNPFFMEEIYQELVDGGSLVRDGSTVRLGGPINALRIPSTVQAVLASRIDRLAPEVKELLQTLAVIGREVPLRLAQRLTPKRDDELDRILRRLERGEFIYERSGAGDVEWIFKHVLTQEVAYSEILVERRKVLHECVGNAIEALYPDALDDHSVALANHFRQSGNAVKASDYLLRAGAVCFRRAAFPEAVSHLSASLELVQALPESAQRTLTQWTLLHLLAVCLSVTAGAGSAQRGDLLMRMKLLCEQIGDDRRMFEVLMNRTFFHSVRNELALESDLGEQAVTLAERLGPRGGLDFALSALGYSLLKRGEFLAARTQLERAISASAVGKPLVNHTTSMLGAPEKFPQSNSIGSEVARALGPTHSGMLVLAYSSWTQWILGFPKLATQTIAEAVRLARNEGSPASLTFALIYAAEFHRFAREPDRTVSFSWEAIEIAERSGLALLKAQAQFEYGWGLAQGTQVSEGLAEVEGAMKALAATGAVASAWRAGPVAECWARSGRPERGLRLLEDALAQAAATGEHFYEAELWRLRGELTLARDSSMVGEAENNFRSAKALAQRQSAKSFELRATISLARLLENLDKGTEAIDLLASIYDSFTEGFETADLRQAKDLYDRLAGPKKILK